MTIKYKSELDECEVLQITGLLARVGSLGYLIQRFCIKLFVLCLQQVFHWRSVFFLVRNTRRKEICSEVSAKFLEKPSLLERNIYRSRDLGFPV